MDDINDLPISYDIAWYESRRRSGSAGVLLYLGVQHIRLGPVLPAFLSPGVAEVLVKHFDIDRSQRSRRTWHGLPPRCVGSGAGFKETDRTRAGPRGGATLVL